MFPSSHSSVPLLWPSPHCVMHWVGLFASLRYHPLLLFQYIHVSDEFGDPPDHIQLFSIELVVVEQPSPSSVLPSSQTSSPTLKPSPGISLHKFVMGSSSYFDSHPIVISNGKDPIGVLVSLAYQYELGIRPLYDCITSPFQVAPA